MKRMSVKLKVTLWYTLAMTLVSAIVLVTMNSLSLEVVERDLRDRLIETVENASRQLVDREGKLRVIPKFMFYDRGVYMALYDSEHRLKDGQIPFDFADTDEISENNKLRVENVSGNKYFIADKKIEARNETYWLRGAVSVADGSYAVKWNFKMNLLLTAILIVIAAIGGYIIISRSFVPVGRISSTAREIAESSDLSRRINIGNGNDEISKLAKTFDNMLEKIESVFEKEKQFTSDASHELRTPLAVIMSECEYMTDCAKAPEDFRESADSVKRQTEKMSKLISELLMISRMDKKTFALSFEKTDVSELLEFVCDEQEELNQNNEIVLERNISKGINADVDRNSLVRLFINIISNAYKYSKGRGTIRVALFEEDKNICFTVKDEGIGIAENELPKIWERFYQVDASRTATEGGGVGLGLSMVKLIAEWHGGSVDVKSSIGVGSEFIFKLPKK